MHGVPGMKWADDLAREAQAWAEKLARARTLQHSSKSERENAGENLAMFTGKFDSAGEEATTMWWVKTLEKSKYHFKLATANKEEGKLNTSFMGKDEFCSTDKNCSLVTLKSVNDF